VTDDRDILRRYSELRDGPGIIVMSLEQCLRYVDAHFARQEKRRLEAIGGADTHHHTRLRGTVSLDYSNNDQRFVIGEGLNLLETQWSTASDTGIYALRDAPSIDAIALAKFHAHSAAPAAVTANCRCSGRQTWAVGVSGAIQKSSR
jgi:hypothetical protein